MVSRGNCSNVPETVALLPSLSIWKEQLEGPEAELLSPREAPHPHRPPSPPPRPYHSVYFLRSVDGSLCFSRSFVRCVILASLHRAPGSVGAGLCVFGSPLTMASTHGQLSDELSSDWMNEPVPFQHVLGQPSVSASFHKTVATLSRPVPPADALGSVCHLLPIGRATDHGWSPEVKPWDPFLACLCGTLWKPPSPCFWNKEAQLSDLYGRLLGLTISPLREHWI